MPAPMTKKWALQILILHVAERVRGGEAGDVSALGEEDRRLIGEAIAKLYRDAYGRDPLQEDLAGLGLPVSSVPGVSRRAKGRPNSRAAPTEPAGGEQAASARPDVVASEPDASAPAASRDAPGSKPRTGSGRRGTRPAM